jgi:SAM-dependent methyltransferase
MSQFHYQGSELELFAGAVRWKAYWAAQCREFIRGDVLEVGAGLGASTELMVGAPHSSWTCLEPDPRLAAELTERTRRNPDLRGCSVVVGTTADLAGAARFDTAIYVDVLEHIADDAAELERAATLLRAGGRVVAVAPAHEFLFTPFDTAIGHHRRYHHRDMTRLESTSLEAERVMYLDSVGLLAALANLLVLRQSMPSRRQLAFWDRAMVPCSVVLDCLTGHRLGKSLLMVWKRSR